MFDFGISYKDWARIVWTGVQGILAYATAAALNWVPGQPWDWKAFGVGVLAAGFSAIKNFALADDAKIK